MSGDRFGRLTTISEVWVIGRKGFQLCLCDCGAEKTVRADHLRSGHTKSCGCLAVDTSTQKATIHGAKGVPEYEIWRGMISRCENPKHKARRYYADRGIKVCPRWRNSFWDFMADMGPRLSPKHSIDRVDNDGNYEPSNCRWATAMEQRHNQRPRRPRDGGQT